MSNADGRQSGRGQPSGPDHLGDEVLSRLVDGDLGPDERHLAETHLATCPACAARLDALRSTISLLQGLPASQPARSFQLAPSHARHPFGWRRLSRWLTIEMPAVRAAVVALVLVVGGAAAFGALRDDDEVRNRNTTNVQLEATVGANGGDSDAPLPGATQTPPLGPTPPNTPSPTATSDASVSRSAPDAAAAEPPTTVPQPTPRVAEEAPAVSAPVAASTATSVPLPTSTPEHDTLFGIDDADASSEEDAASSDRSVNGVDPASDDASSDTAAGEAATSDAAAHAESTATRDESSAGDAAGADQEGIESKQSADAQEDASAAESAPASSASFAEPTATVSPAHTVTPRPTMSPASPVASPIASPAASPAASPVVAVSGQAIPIDEDAPDAMTPLRIDLMVSLAIVVVIGGIAAARATSQTPG